MQAEYYTGYYDKQSSDYIGRFLDYHYNVSLTNWDYSSVLNYSASLLYIRYLAERFGDDVIKRLYTASDSGILAVESATGVDFDEIFKDFVMAVFISGRGISTVPKYNFKTIDIRAKGGLAAFSNLDVGRNVTFPILPYSMQLIRWNGVVTKISISDSVEAYGAPIFD